MLYVIVTTKKNKQKNSQVDISLSPVGLEKYISWLLVLAG